MKTRALIAAFALSAIVLGSGVSAFAYNGYHNYGNHAGMYAVSPENQGAYDAMMKDYYSRVSPIQDKLNAKGIELDALSRNPNAKPETISKLANEVAELRSQLRAERMTLGDKMEKEPRYPALPRHDGQRYDGQRHGLPQRRPSWRRSWWPWRTRRTRRRLRFQLQLLAPGARGRFLPRGDTPDTLQGAKAAWSRSPPPAATRNVRGQPLHHNSERFFNNLTSAPSRGDCLPRSRCFVQGSLREGKGSRHEAGR